ncbi:MAG: hypothetical protein ACYDCA_01405 [Candidatus Tyrphobacter sp.]
MADKYRTKGRGELPVDRIVFGYISGKYGHTERQVPIRCQNTVKRIDYLHGGTKSGTYIELVVRRTGPEWLASQNNSELNKLLRAHGRVRALMIVDVSKFAPITEEEMRADYADWVSTAGRFKRRHITIVYAGADSQFSFGLKTGTTGTATVSDI